AASKRLEAEVTEPSMHPSSSTGDLTRRALLRGAAGTGAVSLALSAPLVLAQEGKPSSRVFRAGAHAVDITPETYPIAMVGQIRNEVPKGAHDRLHARGLVIDDGNTAVAIVVVDSGAIPRALLDEAKSRAHDATGIPTNRMLISATHTHT